MELKEHKRPKLLKELTLLDRFLFDEVMEDRVRLHQRVAAVKNSESSEVRYMQLWEEKAMERLENLEEGRVQGLDAGMKAFILDHLEDGVFEERILEKLQKRFGLSMEDAASRLDSAKSEGSRCHGIRNPSAQSVTDLSI